MFMYENKYLDGITWIKDGNPPRKSYIVKLNWSALEIHSMNLHVMFP